MTSTTTPPAGPPVPRLRALRDEVFAAADAVTPDRTLTLSVGVRVRIAGEELAARLTPALVEGDVAPRIDIVAWAGEPVPPTLDVADEHYSAQDGIQVLQFRDAVQLADGDRAAFWVRDAAALERWETAAPLRTLLRWTLRPLQLVHAAAVVGPRGAALLAGPSGAGKSTTALAAAQHGLGFVGDDYCAVDGQTVHALFAVGKLDKPWPGLRILPGGETLDGKHLVVPRGLTPSAPLVSIVLPRVDGTLALQPARWTEALGALATSLLLLPRSRQEDLAALGRLARSLPAYRLTTGPDPHAAAAALAEHLA
jgi:hypothetical protein